MTRQRRRSRAALAVLLVLGLAACSSGDDDPEPQASPTTATVPSTSGASAGNGYCEFIRSYMERFNRVDVGVADPARLRTTLQDAATAIEQAQGSAPEELRADLRTVSGYFQRFLTVLQQANYDISKVPLGSIQQIQTPEAVAATQRLETYARDNCQ